MHMKQNQITFKLIDETCITIDGADICELEIQNVHQERSLFVERKLNIDNYAHYLFLTIYPAANIPYADNSTVFDMFMYQSSIDEICLQMEYNGQPVVESYTFYQDSTLSGDLDMNDYQKQYIDKLGCLHIDIVVPENQ